MPIHPLKKFQKELRTSHTDAEKRLWHRLRNRNLNHFKFRRQHILHGYIVDFVCLKKKLIVELDGGQHLQQKKQYDDNRTTILKENGYQVLRFWNSDVLSNLDSVLQTIYHMLMGECNIDGIR